MKIQNINHRKIPSLGNNFKNLNLIEHPHGGLIAFYSNIFDQNPANSKIIYDYFVSFYDIYKQKWDSPQLALRLEVSDKISSTFFLDLKGNIQFIFSVDGSLKKSVSYNYGITWDTPKAIYPETSGWKLKNQPVFIGFGRIVLPVYNYLNGRSFALISDDHGLNWYPSTFIELAEDETEIGRIGKNEQENLNYWLKSKYPVFIQRGEKEIISFMEMEKAKVISRAISDSYGETWMDAHPTTIPSSNSPIDALLLRNEEGDFLDELVLIYIMKDQKSSSLIGSFSYDFGENWFDEVKIIENVDGIIDNPSVVQSKYNRIDIIYSINNNYIQHSELELIF